MCINSVRVLKEPPQYQLRTSIPTSIPQIRTSIPLVLALLSRNCPLRKQIKQLFSSFLCLFFLLCPLFRKDLVKSVKIWNLKFVFILKWVNSLNRYHNQYLLKLLTVSFCFLTFVVYLVIVKFIIYSILAFNSYIDNCTAC